MGRKFVKAESIGLDAALDRCLTLLEEGKTHAECLSRFPEHAADLYPLLETVAEIKRVPPPAPSMEAVAVGKQRMLETLAEKKHAQQGLATRLKAWIDSLLDLERYARPRGIAQPALRSALVIASVFALVAFGALLASSWLNTSVYQEAALKMKRGVVYVLASDGEVWQPASEGEQVGIGDLIRTGNMASVELVFFDGSVTELGSGTEVTIAQMSSRRDGSNKVIILHQWLGQTRNQVQRLIDKDSLFKVETASAVATVHGTSFTLLVEPNGTTRVRVSEGTVGVQAQGVTVAVRGGEETLIQPGHSPAFVQPDVTPEPTGVTNTPQPPDAASTSQPSGPTNTPEPPGVTRTSQPSGLTNTPEPLWLTNTPQPPEVTSTPQPSGLTNTPEPLWLTNTPEPPRVTITPQPLGPTNTPEPPGLTNTPEPPGLTNTPEPPRVTITPQPLGPTNTPEPPGLTNTPEPPGLTNTPEPPVMTITSQPPSNNTP
jgi:hypothetical protein